jgi:hypothetical protein
MLVNVARSCAFLVCNDGGERFQPSSAEGKRLQDYKAGPIDDAMHHDVENNRQPKACNSFAKWHGELHTLDQVGGTPASARDARDPCTLLNRPGNHLNEREHPEPLYARLNQSSSPLSGSECLPPRFWTAVAERSGDTAFAPEATPKSGVALRFPPQSKTVHRL